MNVRKAILQGLANAPGIALSTTLIRCVAFDPLVSHAPPNFLLTSGKPNRYNPAGVECLYFADSERTALAEYQRQWAGLCIGAKQPLVMFYAVVHLHRVLDLTTKHACDALRLTKEDLYAPWRRAKRSTKTQMLGLAMSGQNSFTAIRYPSDAAKAAGIPGSNIVIFKVCVRKPDSVCILGPTKKPLQEWP